MTRSIALGSAVLLLATTAWAQQPVPAVGHKPKAELPEHVTQALDAAHHKNKRTLLAFLGEDEASTKLGALLKKDRKLAHELLYEFVVVTMPVTDAVSARAFSIDLGRDLPALVVTDDEAKPLATLRNGDLVVDDAVIAGAALVEKFTPLHCKPLDGQKVFDAALATAKKDGKCLFVHFDAPW